MDEKNSKIVYIEWIFVFILLFAAIIALGVWTAQRDAQREAEGKYGFDGYTSTVSYLTEVERISDGYTDAVKTVRLELFKRELYQSRKSDK